MFRKYEKTFHITGDRMFKRLMDSHEISHLFNGEVVVEEKVDGANVGIIRTKKGIQLQKRGSLVGPSEHAQFQRFHAWAQYENYNKLMEIPIGYTVYGELMYAVHTVYYDALPDWVLVFDIYDWKNKRYLTYDERNEFCLKYGLYQVPLLDRGHFEAKDVPSMLPVKSSFGPQAEGIVIKRYIKKSKQYVRGKYVHPDFLKTVDESDHWIKGELRINRLRVENE